MSQENGRFEKGNEIGKETRFKQNHKVPVKYKEKYCEDIIEYFTEREREVIYERKYYKDGTLQCETPKFVLAPRLPTFEMFAANIGVTVQTLLNWCDKYPHFLSAYAKAKSMQLAMLKTHATMKAYDSNFAKFLCVNDHGMTEQTKTDVTYRVVVGDDIDEESD